MGDFLRFSETKISTFSFQSYTKADFMHIIQVEAVSSYTTFLSLSSNAPTVVLTMNYYKYDLSNVKVTLGPVVLKAKYAGID